MRAKQWFKTVLTIIFGMLVIGFVVVPLSYYVESPGAMIDPKELITVNSKEDKGSDSPSLTSVSIRQATGFLVLKAKLAPFEELTSKRELTGGATNEEYSQMQQYYTNSSQNAAIEQALKLTGKPYETEFKGVYVVSIEKTSNFLGKFSVGDTVAKIDDKSF